MARKVSQEINWKPRSQRKLELLARREHLQMHLPFAGSGVLAGDENGVAPVASETVAPPKKSKFAVLLWEPRSQGKTP